ncbi:MAG: hypothetical protein L6R40_000544 [Gallowayella cf. fulva]|nr:MAG: hypothetical protein L6R40_000544 [Xanthomendoza cf. fulva]
MGAHLKNSLLAAGLAVNIGALASGVTLTTRVYPAVCYPSNAPGGNGGGGSGEIKTVGSTYGVYNLVGCYAAPPSGYLLDGKTSVSVGMTLSSCASYCPGSPFFALQNDGSVIVVTSSTAVPPPPPVSSSVITYVTTNPAGSTITTSRSTVVTLPSSNPPPPPTSVIVRTSTNPQGSVIVTSSTSTAADTGETEAAWCGSSYSDNLGQLWIVQCQTAYYYSDLTTVTVGSFEACLEACDLYVPSPNVARGASCIAVTYGARTNGGECYRKFNVTDSRFDRREDSAYKVGQSIIPPPASSIVNTNVASTGASTPAGSTGNVQPTSGSSRISTGNVQPTSAANIPATSNPNLPTSRPYTPSTSNPSVPTTAATTTGPAPIATLIGSSTTASSINPTLAYQPCPSSNGQRWPDPLGYVYDIDCGCDYQYNDLISPHYDTFQDCILACDRYVSDPNIARGALCVGVSWAGPNNRGGNCFLKYSLAQIRCGYPEYCAAKKIEYTLPSGFSSTSRTRAPTSTASVVPIASSTPWCSDCGPVASSSQPPAVVPSSSSSRPPVVVPSSSSSQPPVVVPTPTPWCSDCGPVASSSQPPVIVPSSSSSPPLVVSPSSTSSSSGPANTFAPPELSGSVRCPANNGSVYTDNFGQRWEIHCGQEIRGTNAKAVHADTFEKCLEFSDILGSVVGATYGGGGVDNPNVNSINCYPYNVFTSFQSGAVPTLVAARPLNGSTGNYFNQEQLCPTYDNETYIDALNRVYEVRCDHAYGGGTNLASTITKSLEGCLTFCSIYNTCVGVTFTQYILGSRTDNCFPKSVLGDVTYQAGNSSAQLITR